MSNAPSKVIALSVGQPKWENIRGNQVFTSIVRPPSPVPLYFGPTGLENNATAVHTEQVLAFSAEHYEYWSSLLNIPRQAWDWCHWGENLTVQGIDENQLRVGDLLEVGPDARFEVTSPRNPCFKLAWRIDQPDSILRTIVETGWVGFYLSVVTPGVVRPGDGVRVIATERPEAITVGDLARMLMGIGDADPARLRQVMALPALGDQARGMVAKRLVMMEDLERLKIGRWKGWRPFEVTQVLDQAQDVRSFELTPKDNQPAAPYRAGQFLTVRLSDSEDGDAISRTWTLSDYEDYPDRYRVTIKRVDAGSGSTWMHTSATLGSCVLVRPPAGRFTFDRSSFTRTVLISAGIGITPMLAMLKARALDGAEGPPLLWIHVTQNSRTHLFAEETKGLLSKYGFGSCVYYSKPLPTDISGVDYDEVGRLTAERLKALVEPHYEIEPFGRSVELEGLHSDIYVCGPSDFENMTRETLLGIGVGEAHFHSESFAAASGARTGSLVQTAAVTFTQTRVGAQWSSDDDMTLLELAETQGLKPNYACRLGLCGVCEAGLLAGEVSYDPTPAVPPPTGRVLVCCARPASDLITLDL